MCATRKMPPTPQAWRDPGTLNDSGPLLPQGCISIKLSILFTLQIPSRGPICLPANIPATNYHARAAGASQATVHFCNRQSYLTSSVLFSLSLSLPILFFSCAHFHLLLGNITICRFSTRVLPSPDRDFVICPTLEPAQKAVTGGQSRKYTARDYTVSTTPG